MDYPININTISMGPPIVYFNGVIYVEFSKMTLKVVLILANSADPDEMQHYAAFHLGLHCFQKYSFRGFPNTKRYK